MNTIYPKMAFWALINTVKNNITRNKTKQIMCVCVFIVSGRSSKRPLLLPLAQ